jgi:hypothetical protein
MFARWVCPEEVALIESLRLISVGVMTRPGARQSARYWGKDFPDFKSIVLKVHGECTKFLGEFVPGTVAVESGQFLQQLLVVAFQVLMPPMRGKPFYTLCVDDVQNNSMHCTSFALPDGAKPSITQISSRWKEKQ